MRFKEHGAAQLGLDREDCRIEAFKMAGLQNAAVFFSEGEKVVGLGERSCDGLFDEDVEAGFEQCSGDAVMVGRGNGDAGGVEAQIGGEQLVNGGEDRDAVFAGGFGGAGRVRLDSGDQGDRQAGRFEFTINTNVIAAESAGSGNGDARDGIAGYWAAPLPSTALRQRA